MTELPSTQKEGQIVGHVRTEMARVVFYFLQRAGTGGACFIAGRRKRVEVPCVYEFFLDPINSLLS